MAEEHFIHCLLAHQGACPEGVGGTQERVSVNGVLYEEAYPTMRHLQPRHIDKECHAGTQEVQVPLCPFKAIQRPNLPGTASET